MTMGVAGGATREGTPRRLLVVGLGNPDRGDDAIGSMVARSAASRLPHGVTVRERAGDMLSLIDDWGGFDAVICIDAAAPAGAPGQIHRLDLAVDALQTDFAFASSHAYGLAEAVALARQLGLAPRDLIIYAVEGLRFDAGEALTVPVAAALPPATARVVEEANRLIAGGGPAHA